MFRQDHNERLVLTKVEEVLLKLKENREKHITILNEAKEGYKAKVLSALQSRINSINSGGKVSASFKLAPPVDRTNEYDKIIAMLELHKNAGEDTIELSAYDVQRFYLDQWEWRDSFLTNNSVYSVSAAMELGTE